MHFRPFSVPYPLSSTLVSEARIFGQRGWDGGKKCPFPPQSDPNSGSNVQQFPSHPVPFPVISDDNRTKSETNQRGIGGEGGERLGEDLRRVDIHMAMPFFIISR